MAEGWGWSLEEQLGLRRVKGAVGGGGQGLRTCQVRGLSSSVPQGREGVPFWCRKGAGPAMAVRTTHRVVAGPPHCFP